MGFLKKILKSGIGGKVAAKLGDPAAKKMMRTGGGGPRASATGQANASPRSRVGGGALKNNPDYEGRSPDSTRGRRMTTGGNTPRDQAAPARRTGGNTPASRVAPPRRTGGPAPVFNRNTGIVPPDMRRASQALDSLGSRTKKPRKGY